MREAGCKLQFGIFAFETDLLAVIAILETHRSKSGIPMERDRGCLRLGGQAIDGPPGRANHSAVTPFSGDRLSPIGVLFKLQGCRPESVRTPVRIWNLPCLDQDELVEELAGYPGNAR